jgi:hypothetical protein
MIFFQIWIFINLIYHFPNTVRMIKMNRVFFSFIVSDRLFRDEMVCLFLKKIKNILSNVLEIQTSIYLCYYLKN